MEVRKQSSMVPWEANSSKSKVEALGRKPVAATRKAVGGPTSLSVNILGWSKILKDEYKENRRISIDDDYEEAEIGDQIPPHEFFARNMMVSLLMHEGTGRTLKGRDLNRVRNAI
ncbi:hypothetical protein ACS0TY_010590 [Phlomoides rotata]